MIRREVVNPESEYSLLGMMIMNDEVMSSAYSRYKSGALKTRHFTEHYKPVFRWLVRYYNEHQKAPKSTIQKIYEKRKVSLSKEKQDIVKDYLERLSEEYEPETNPDYIRKEVLPDFIRERELDQRIQKAQMELDSGDYSKAERTISTYQVVPSEDEDAELGTITPYTLEDVTYGFDPANKLKEAFRFSGDMHRLVGPLCASWLVAIAGTEKAGKSYILQEIGYEAALYQKKKVLVINIELSAPVARNRLWRRISKTANKRYAGWSHKPLLDCQNNQYHTCLADSVKIKRMNKKPLFRTQDETISINSITKNHKWKVCTKCKDDNSSRKNAAKNKRFVPAIWYKKVKVREITELRVKNAIRNKKFSNLSNFRMKCFPRFTVTFTETKDYIMRYIDKTGWKPDIIIYDYLDILLPEGNLEGRFAVDDVWKRASGLAGELDCLVFTADQSTKGGRIQYALDQMSTSESKTKDSHLDVRIAFSNTDDEKDLGLIRSNVVFHRHELFNVRREVLLTQRIATAQPMLDNAFFPDRGKKFRITQ